MFLVYAALILLPFARASARRIEIISPAAVLAAPTMSIFYCFNIFTKLAVGALSGFEYVAILAGETRSPARDIGRSVADRFTGDRADVHSRAPVRCSHSSETIRSILLVRCRKRCDSGLGSFPIAGAIASIGILLMTMRTIASTSVHVTGSSRLPMVAGWDRTAAELVFASASASSKRRSTRSSSSARPHLLIAIASQIGAGIQEAFQLVDNAANVFYGIVYFTMFAIPIFGAGAIRSGAPIWLRIAAICGAAVSLSAIFFTIYPIIDVPSPLEFRRENHCRDRNCECDRRRDLPRLARNVSAADCSSR